MTVQELIALLKTLPPDLPTFVPDLETDELYTVKKVELESIYFNESLLNTSTYYKTSNSKVIQAAVIK